MLESTRPKLNPVKYAVMLAGALAVAAVPPLGVTAVASAEKVWDLEFYDYCMQQARAAYQRGEATLQELTEYAQGCCEGNGGVWNPGTQDCQAPPGDTQGARQLRDNVRIPSDITTATPPTKAPPRPIQVASDAAIAQAATQADG